MMRRGFGALELINNLVWWVTVIGGTWALRTWTEWHWALCTSAAVGVGVLLLVGIWLIKR